MKLLLTFLTGLLLAGGASASEVYVVTDAKGNRVYTDRPESLPAEKVSVRTSPSDGAGAQNGAPGQTRPGLQDAPPKSKPSQAADAAKVEQLTAEDQAKRCADARRRYEVAMNSSRLYEQGPSGERRYLTSEEINAARINAKQTMDTFCGDQ